MFSNFDILGIEEIAFSIIWQGASLSYVDSSKSRLPKRRVEAIIFQIKISFRFDRVLKDCFIS
jgi:hypothetical protein